MTTEPTTTIEHPTGIRWLVFVLACGTSWFLYLHRYTWNFILPELKRDYGITNTEGGTLGSLFLVSYAIFQIPSGIASDLLGPHLFLGVLILAWSLVVPCFGLVHTFPALGVLRFVFGAAQAGAYPALGKITYSWFPLRSRTTIQAWVATFSGRTGGAMSSLIMATLLMGAWGLSWRTALGVMGLAGVLFGLAFLALFRDSPERDPRTNEAERVLIRGEASAGKPATGRAPPFRRMVRSTTIRILLVQQFASAGADVVYTLFLGDYFQNERGFRVSTAGILVALPFLGGALGGMAGGVLNDLLARVTGSRRWARSGVGFAGKAVACALIFVAVGQEDGVAAAIALFFVKFFTDWSQPSVWGTCSDLGRSYTATVFATVNTAANIGGILTPILFGMILDHYDYSAFFTAIAVLYSVSAVSWFWIDCTEPLLDDPSDHTDDGLD